MSSALEQEYVSPGNLTRLDGSQSDYVIDSVTGVRCRTICIPDQEPTLIDGVEDDRRRKVFSEQAIEGTLVRHVCLGS